MKLPAIQFYPGDWLRDHVSGCSLAAQGLWLRMMFLMHDSKDYGYLGTECVPLAPEFVSRKCGCDSVDQYTTLLAELEAASIPSRNKKNVIHSRRMVRDASARERSSSRSSSRSAERSRRYRDRLKTQETPENLSARHALGHALERVTSAPSSSSASTSTSEEKYPPNPPPGGTDGRSEPELSSPAGAESQRPPPATTAVNGHGGSAAALNGENGTDTRPAKSDAAKRPRKPATAIDDTLPGFNRFWAEYPAGRRVDPNGCREKWRRRGLEAQVNDILAGLARWIASEQWVKDGGRFIAMSSTWLHQSRWVTIPEPADGGNVEDGYAALGLAPSRNPTAAELEILVEAGRASGGSGDLL